MITKEDFMTLYSAAGHTIELDWSEELIPCDSGDRFFMEYCEVVINAGTKMQTARIRHDKVVNSLLAGGIANDVLEHKGKATAIDHVFLNRDAIFQAYLNVPDSVEEKLEYLSNLPWIGQITKWYLLKNLGLT